MANLTSALIGATNYTVISTDTKNTAGSTDTSSKIYLVGATSQAANPQTYSQDTAYVGTDGCLYSGGNKVLTTNEKGAASGVAELDANGLVPSSQLPSYVDEVIEGYYYNDKFYKESTHTTEITGETGKIYVNLESGADQNKTYRWSGSAFVVISETLALGETSSTAYRGDRGKTAYDHATDSSRLTTATASGLYKVASTAQGHIASLTAVAKADITGLGIPDTDNAVTQTNSNEIDDNHRVLLSHSANATTETDGVYKNAFLTYNPFRKALTLGTRDTFTYGVSSLVIGDTCSAIGDRSLAIGNHTIAGSQNQLVIGVYNKTDGDNIYAFIVGNGDSTERSDAMTIAKGGSIWSAGNISADGNISANNISTTSVTSAEFNRLAGVTNNIQTQLNGKQGTITGAVSTVTDSNLTASMAMVTSATGKVDTSSVTAVELNRLSGVTNNVQTQLDGKISPGNLNTYVFTRDFTVSAKTVSASGAASYTKTDSIPATGERILGVVGYEVTGTNRTRAGIYKTSVTQAGGFEVGIYNPQSSDASWGLTVTCLYLKVSSS